MKEREIRNKKRHLYFAIQKVLGLLLLMFTAFVVKVLEGDATVALLTVPVSCVLIFSKELLLVNKYFWSRGGSV